MDFNTACDLYQREDPDLEKQELIKLRGKVSILLNKNKRKQEVINLLADWVDNRFVPLNTECAEEVIEVARYVIEQDKETE